jgi:glycosyltransferase involved in cell wall biosynthesis
MKKLYLVSNDKIWLSKKKSTSNNDLDTIISCLVKDYNIKLINRESKTKLNFVIKDKFDFCNLNNIKDKNIKLLMVSISPYNFFVLLRLIFISNISVKGYVYLRSDGFLEYKYRYGLIGYYFYYLMFLVIKKYLKVITCSKNFTKINIRNIIHPSELTKIWFNNVNSKNKNKSDFLYIGRFKKDKGALYLANLFKNQLKEYKLTVVGTEKKFINKNFYSKNINYLSSISETKKLIKIYDSTKIFILPSYIEGFPKVISESLARLRPVIIFEDIKYVVNGRKGIFICKRNDNSLRKTITYIFNNYKNIQKKIKKNYFFTKDNFKKELLTSLKK